VSTIPPTVTHTPAGPSAPGQITRGEIEKVHSVIGPYLRRTPVITTSLADFGLPGGTLVLKLEHLQHTGSFKARGAFANLLLRDIPDVGVVAASGGNHGAAVAYAAGRLSIRARVYVPAVSSPAKIARIRAYGADLVVGGESYSEALAASQEWADVHGGLQVHAFDQPETVLGAGTLGIEVNEQAPEVTAVLAGVGGGGLLAGLAAGYAGQAHVVGVEPAGAPTLTAALAAGHPVDAEVGSVAIDSLAPRRVGDITYPLIASLVSQVLLVSDEEIRAAQSLLWDRLRIVAEPGGCAALAAVLSGTWPVGRDDCVAVVISGANTTAVSFTD
jgi:threonine dehydratase